MAARAIWLTGLLLLASCLLSACGGASGQEAGADGQRTVTLRARSGASATLKVEVADTEAERGHGLSGRTHLDADAGMLFVLDGRKAGFWMKDTLIPLSVAFIAACGEIVHIADMQPQSLEIHNTFSDYIFGLETNLGWYARRGIGVGDRLELPEELRPPGC
jgi:uncharacterized membrane protein (UPF0127 family)